MPPGWAGPNLLATILFEKFGQHQPLNRQAERYVMEGIDISLSTLADQVGIGTVALEPIHSLIGAHVLAATRLHGDDTTVPLLARGGTRQARLWTNVRDDRPFAGGAPPAALFFFSTDREKIHPNRHLAGWTGILQADAYGGYNDLYREGRDPGPITSALCWSHARRKFFELADIAGNVRKGKPAHAISPVALAAVTRMDALFTIERDINGLDAEARRQARQRLSRPRIEGLHRWLLGRKPGCSPERGGGRAAFMYTLIVTAKLNDVDPQVWLADVLARMPNMPVSRLPELLPLELGDRAEQTVGRRLTHSGCQFKIRTAHGLRRMLTMAGKMRQVHRTGLRKPIDQSHKARKSALAQRKMRR